MYKQKRVEEKEQQFKNRQTTQGKTHKTGTVEKAPVYRIYPGCFSNSRDQYMGILQDKRVSGR